MAIYVENCCESYCNGCPWAEEQLRLEKEAEDKKKKDKEKKERDTT